jgi:hypothetical protein
LNSSETSSVAKQLYAAAFFACLDIESTGNSKAFQIRR